MTKFFTRDKTLYQRFFIMTLTIALQNVIVTGVNLADNIMIGAYNQTSMSGIALVNQIQYLLHMVIMGAGEGIIIISSRYWGKRDIEGIKKVASVGMRVAVVCAMLLWLVVFLFPSHVLRLFTPETAVIAEGAKYARIVCFSYPLFAATTVLLATMRSVETVKIGFYVSLTAMFTNVILNYLLIYGIGIFPELGGRGAAIATVAARGAELIVVLVYVGFIDKKLKLRPGDYFAFNRDVAVTYAKISLPLIASSAIWGVAQGTQAGILGRLGEETIAANSIAATVFQIISVVIYGSASATSVIIGKTLGEGKQAYIKEYTRTLQVLYIGLGLLTGTALFLFKDFIIGFYNITPETYKLALQFMTVSSVTVVGTAYQMACLTGIARGGGDTKIILINDSIHMWLIVIPISALAAFIFEASPVIVYICLKSDQILKCGVAAYWINSYRWIKKI
ncbi:MAG: MATE family efflux transporter [Eubacteriales bacterium]|jgi:putative MATE family efflux protein|nr:MATE family efflux transporter [Eubacteriales bacterium]